MASILRSCGTKNPADFIRKRSKNVTNYEAFFTEISENGRFAQSVGGRCKVFFAYPVLGGIAKLMYDDV